MPAGDELRAEEHQQALHEIAAILIEHETIDKEQFERLLRGEPEHIVLRDDAAPEKTTRAKPQRKRAPRSRSSRAPIAKPLPSASVAHAVQREDLRS